MTFLLELRTEAIHHHDPKTRQALKDVANDLQLAIRVFESMPCDETLRAVNSTWAKAMRMIYVIGPRDGGGGSGQPLTEEQRMAA